jgi:hypothetical protein
MDETKTEIETPMEKKLREMAESDLRRAVETMKMMNWAFDRITRTDRMPPSDGDGEGVRISER